MKTFMQYLRETATITRTGRGGGSGTIDDNGGGGGDGGGDDENFWLKYRDKVAAWVKAKPREAKEIASIVESHLYKTRPKVRIQVNPEGYHVDELPAEGRGWAYLSWSISHGSPEWASVLDDVWGRIHQTSLWRYLEMQDAEEFHRLASNRHFEDVVVSTIVNSQKSDVAIHAYQLVNPKNVNKGMDRRVRAAIAETVMRYAARYTRQKLQIQNITYEFTRPEQHRFDFDARRGPQRDYSDGHGEFEVTAHYYFKWRAE